MAKEDETPTAGGQKAQAEADQSTQAKTDAKAATGSTAGGGASGTSASGTSGSSTEKNAQSGAKPAGAAKSSNAGETASAGKRDDAITLLKSDHQEVEALFAEFETANDRRKDQIVREACQALIVHTLLEEELFYPACREAADEDDPLDEAQVEHDSAKLLIRELLDGGADDYRDAKFKVLAEQVRHHVAEEEKPREGIFAKAQSSGVDTAELGRRIKARKQELMSRQDALRPSRPVSFQRLEANQAYRQEEEDMPRDNGRERDERGRFTSDDDDRGGRRYASERSGGGGGRRSRYDDDRDSRGRGQGGWFGDSQGHSEASRRGWERSDHEGSGWYGDSRGHSEASRRGWERSDHEGSGWYGDPEGHSEASRRGWDERRSFSGRDRDYDDRDRGGGGNGGGRSRDDDDRGYRSRGRDDDDRGYRGRGRDDDDGRGWYGDSRGHSEAARKGWESRRDDDDDRGSRGRSSRDDDDRGYRSRSRDDDDDRRSSSSSSRGGRSQGGWFGDAEGHSEASRRGWENRR
ncbi:hemerythrin domain-containing protein [Phenylobacterium sp.]|uniref:hemerythrin domain-containing protein n=1 Tax=Phenylobacterium sp. TaxID=1871053 RepID=UPI0025CE2CB3|nr:hemerythrin domain-containing protein [Phenylobacterium sp.]